MTCLISQNRSTAQRKIDVNLSFLSFYVLSYLLFKIFLITSKCWIANCYSISNNIIQQQYYRNPEQKISILHSLQKNTTKNQQPTKQVMSKTKKIVRNNSTLVKKYLFYYFLKNVSSILNGIINSLSKTKNTHLLTHNNQNISTEYKIRNNLNPHIRVSNIFTCRGGIIKCYSEILHTNFCFVKYTIFGCHFLIHGTYTNFVENNEFQTILGKCQFLFNNICPLTKYCHKSTPNKLIYNKADYKFIPANIVCIQICDLHNILPRSSLFLNIVVGKVLRSVIQQ
eukprot:TRINITY_DN7800_c0_g1_i3.p1 TRINITY_DN7800_c0_g1~~TRINITY_DN7800_c0_g1_i3.p1  ORF type:complete len:283 (-),score=-27.18 TRINITY_DN7800_c0_g1_i3:335-1183(-)